MVEVDYSFWLGCLSLLQIVRLCKVRLFESLHGDCLIKVKVHLNLDCMTAVFLKILLALSYYTNGQ